MRYDCKPIKETIESDLKYDTYHTLTWEGGMLYCMTERKMDDGRDQYVAYISCSLCGTFPSAGEWQHREWKGITTPICDECHEERAMSRCAFCGYDVDEPSCGSAKHTRHHLVRGTTGP